MLGTLERREYIYSLREELNTCTVSGQNTSHCREKMMSSGKYLVSSPGACLGTGTKELGAKLINENTLEIFSHK